MQDCSRRFFLARRILEDGFGSRSSCPLEIGNLGVKRGTGEYPSLEDFEFIFSDGVVRFILVDGGHHVVIIRWEGYAIIELTVVKLTFDDDFCSRSLPAFEKIFHGMDPQLAFILGLPMAIVTLRGQNGTDYIIKNFGLVRISLGKQVR